MQPKRPSHVESVELQRLQALVETQRKHIEELNAQLHELLEVKRQQQLQLVQQSPAPRNVKQLLARAAADNTALAKKVEELRAQRNALAVTKAALTAQMSELIRAAADDAQLEIQHKRLLAQVQQLYQLTGQQGACQPTAQLAALKSCMEMAMKQALHAHPACCTGNTSQQPHTPAAADASLSHSPTGQQLDSKATSQLIWWDGSCTDISREATTDTLDDTPVSGVAEPAVSKYTGDATYKTGRSCFTDMSYISPMRGSSTAGETPHSKTPNTAQMQYGDGLGSPLSCQSLSQLSSSKSTPGDDLAPRRLDLEATPVSKLQGAGVGDACSSSKPETRATPVALVRGLDQSPSKDHCRSSRNSVDLGFSASPVLLMSPVFGFKPEELEQQGFVPGPRDTTNSSAADRSQSKKPSAGLQLEAEFRLAACETLWPSPAVQGSSCISSSSLSHATWLAGRQPVSPIASGKLTFSHALLDDWEGSDEEQQSLRSSRRHRALAVSLLVIAPLAVVAAARGAAAWRFKHSKVLGAVAAMRKGLQVAAQQTVLRAAVGWKVLQQGLSAGWAKAKQLGQHRKASMSSTSAEVLTEYETSDGVAAE